MFIWLRIWFVSVSRLDCYRPVMNIHIRMLLYALRIRTQHIETRLRRITSTASNHWCKNHFRTTSINIILAREDLQLPLQAVTFLSPVAYSEYVYGLDVILIGLVGYSLSITLSHVWWHLPSVTINETIREENHNQAGRAYFLKNFRLVSSKVDAVRFEAVLLKSEKKLSVARTAHLQRSHPHVSQTFDQRFRICSSRFYY